MKRGEPEGGGTRRGRDGREAMKIVKIYNSERQREKGGNYFLLYNVWQFLWGGLQDQHFVSFFSSSLHLLYMRTLRIIVSLFLNPFVSPEIV